MGMASDVLLGGAITFVTRHGGLAVTCGRGCGHTADLGCAVDLTGQIAAARHPCPAAGLVFAEVLASVETPVPVGGDR